MFELMISSECSFVGLMDGDGDSITIGLLDGETDETLEGIEVGRWL
jgi:hypothetical protein